MAIITEQSRIYKYNKVKLYLSNFSLCRSILLLLKKLLLEMKNYYFFLFLIRILGYYYIVKLNNKIPNLEIKEYVGIVGCLMSRFDPILV